MNSSRFNTAEVMPVDRMSTVRANAPSPLSPVEAALESLSTEIHELHGETETLITRLDSVMRNVPLPAAVEGDREGSLIPLADKVLDLRYRVARLRVSTGVANDRLGL